MKKVLILGSNGFIGRNLAEVLVRRDDISVSGFGHGSDSSGGALRKFTFGDFQDQNALSEAIRGQDVVYHLISQTIPTSSWNDPLKDVESNLLPTIRLIEAAASAGVQRIAFASSGGTVYGQNDAVADEDSVTDPFSPYGIVKRATESFLRYAHVRYGLDHDVYRISNVYGEGQDTRTGLGFINTALECIVNNKPVIVYGDGETVRDYIYVKDVAGLMASSVRRQAGKSGIYNVSANRPMSLNAILELMRNVVGVEFRIEYVKGRANDNRVVRIDGSRIIAETGGSGLVPLEEGIGKTYEFLKKQSMYVKTGV